MEKITRQQRREVGPPGFQALGWAWRCDQCDAVQARPAARGGLTGGRRPAACCKCGQRNGSYQSATVYACERCDEWVCHNETNEHREECEG